MCVAAVIGVLGGFGAILFRELIEFVQATAYGDPDYSLSLLERLEWWHVLLVPAAGGAVVGPIVYFFAREAKGHGVPEVMDAVATKQGVIRKRIVVAKSLASAVTIGTGGSVGREGPIVQIGSAIGSAMGQILKLPRTKMRTLVGCGAAAGIAATFNAPVAGALFALEVILGDFGVRRFTPIVISSVIATAVSRHFVGDFPAFEIKVSYGMVTPFELLTYPILGIASAVVAVIYIKSVYFSEDMFDKIRIPEYIKPVLGGLMIGAIGLYCPRIFGVGYETVDQALNDEILPWGFLFLFMGIKLIATSLTLGGGGSGGVFAPSLFMGALLGGGLGHLFHSLFPTLTATPGAYALVGMGALVAAATRSPLTSIMIIFEMTGDYKIILPLMLACIIGNTIATRINRHSIYTLKLARRGVNLMKGRDINLLAALDVEGIYSSRYVAINDKTQLGEMLHLMVEKSDQYFYVKDTRDRFKGAVAVEDLPAALVEGDMLKDLLIARDIMKDDIPLIHPDEKLDKVMFLFGHHNRDEFPVVERGEGGRLLGVVTRRALINAYNGEILKRDAVSGVRLGLEQEGSTEPVMLPGGIAIAEVEAPGWMAGRTLAALDLRKRHGLQVMMVISAEEGSAPGEPRQIVPRPDYTIRLGDNLLLLGQEKEIKGLLT